MMFKAILCLAFVANAVVAVPSHSRRHHDLAVRMASPNNFEPVAVVQRRSNSGRCKQRSTTSTATPSPTTTNKVVGNVGSAPPTTETPAHTSSQDPPKPSSPPPTTTKTSSTHQSQPTQSQSSGGGGGGQTFSGDGTYYDIEGAATACGQTFTNEDFVVAIAMSRFDSYPNYNGVNPNTNPVCGRKITAHYNGNSVTVTVSDRCTGCAFNDLDFTPAALAVLEPNYLQIGRIHDVVWSYSS